MTTYTNWRVDYIAPNYDEGHTFEPRCWIMADVDGLGPCRIFDVPDPDEDQRMVAQAVCDAMNAVAKEQSALREVRTWLIAPATDAATIAQMRQVVTAALPN